MRSPKAARLLEPLPEAERFAAVQLVESDGTILSGGDASAAVLRHVGLSPLAPLARRLYPLVARHRARLGRLVPEGPAPDPLPLDGSF